MSPSHVGKAFRAYTGTTPIRYLQRLRVVAAQVGLCGASYLWRLVVRQYGRSPRDLREEALGLATREPCPIPDTATVMRPAP